MYWNPRGARGAAAALVLLLPLVLSGQVGAQALGPGRGLAVTQVPSSVLAQTDIVIRPADGSPYYQLTIDARSIPDAVQDVKLPVGWAGSNAIAFAAATGQQAAQEPLYLQRIDSPRRVQIDSNIVNAAPAPAGATIAALGYVSHFFLHLIDATTLHRTTMPLPANHASLTVYGTDPLAWSPDGSRLAIGWVEGSGLRVAVCTLAGRCSSAFHGTDLPLGSSAAGWTFELGWLSPSTLLLSVAPAFGERAGVLVTLPAANLAARASPALAVGHRVAGRVLGLTVAPAGDYAVLIVKRASSKSPALQVARVSGNTLVPGASYGITGETGGVVAGAFLAFAAPAQSWIGHSVLYSQDYFQATSGRLRQEILRLDAATGQRTLIQANAYWAAIEPTGPAISSISKTQGACPDPPDAVTTPGVHFGLDPKLSVQETVAYSQTLRSQAYRLDDSSCLGTVMSGSALAAVEAGVGRLAAGEFGVVFSSTTPTKIQVDLKTGTATETAKVVNEIQVYRGPALVSRAGAASGTATFHLKLKDLGKVHGYPISRWMITSVTGEVS